MLHIFTFQVQDRPKKENSNRENIRLQEGRLGVKLHCHPHIANYLYRIHVHIQVLHPHQDHLHSCWESSVA